MFDWWCRHSNVYARGLEVACCQETRLELRLVLEDEPFSRRWRSRLRYTVSQPGRLEIVMSVAFHIAHALGVLGQTSSVAPRRKLSRN